jgi:hypothetical protein
MTSTSGSPFCHIAIPAQDLRKAQVFYRGVFGWQITEDVPDPRYWFFQSGNVGGALDGSLSGSATGVVLVLSVTDITESLRLVTEHGGTVVRGRSAIGEASDGFDAYFLDPNGNKVGIYSAS